ncbi:hypothetical protein KG112_17280 [Nocardioides sp. zg-ZUI104]|nr:hypothetical protein [Nocardioides faecalis]
MAVDRDVIIDAVLGGKGVGAESAEKFFPPVFATNGKSELAYDPDAARKLVEGAGEAKVTLRYTVGRYSKDKEVGEAVAGMLESVGFDVKRVEMDGAEFFAKKSTPGSTGSGSPPVRPSPRHPDVLVHAFLGSAPTTKYCAGDFYDTAGAAGLAASAPAELTRLYTEIENRVLNEDVCFVPLYLSNGISWTRSGVNLETGYDTLVNYRTLSWKN